MMATPIAHQVSLFADMGLLLPVSTWLIVWIALSNLRLAWHWFLAMAGLFALVGASKLAWALWHVELPWVHFRMLSGHMALAYSVWPTASALVVGALFHRYERRARMLAYLACAGIGVSRLVAAHTPAEIVAGSALGLCVDLHFRARMHGVIAELLWPRIFAIAFLVLVLYAYGSPIYSVGWFDRAAARLRR